MQDQFVEQQTITRRKISATGVLGEAYSGPHAAIIAQALDTHAHDGAWGLVSDQIAAIGEAAELVSVKAALSGLGRPFETLFPVEAPGTYAALRQVLDRSGEAELGLFADSLSLLELDALARFPH